MEFEWDPGKAATNLHKHGVSFTEASSVFADPLASIFPDTEHSDSESREILVGYSERGRLLIVSFTERPPNVRIISARVATPRRTSQPRKQPPRYQAMSDELKDEYAFDYSKAKPNRFASAMAKGGRLVVLEPEVAAAFHESHEVNAVLKALLKTMPHRQDSAISSAS
jgi:uncharacterized protein